MFEVSEGSLSKALKSLSCYASTTPSATYIAGSMDIPMEDVQSHAAPDSPKHAEREDATMSEDISDDNAIDVDENFDDGDRRCRGLRA